MMVMLVMVEGQAGGHCELTDREAMLILAIVPRCLSAS